MKKRAYIFIGAIGICWFLFGPAFAFKYRLPEEAFDKKIAQLQPKILNRSELTPLEEEENKKYGYTGMEIITYWWSQTEPQLNCTECKRGSMIYLRPLLINRRGHIRERYWLLALNTYYSRSYMDEIDPTPELPIGAIVWKGIIIIPNPPYVRGTGLLIHFYSENLDKPREDDNWLWLPNLRRVRRLSAADKEDGVLGSDMTTDDNGSRKPFEETHRIVGEDTFRGIDCFVVESKSIFPDYYLKRRMSWISKKTFLLVHEEQFDREGRLWKIQERHFHPLKQYDGAWARHLYDIIDFSSGHRTYAQYANRMLDIWWPEEMFTEKQLRSEEVFLKVKNPFPPVKSASELPPPPQIKGDFWEKLGEKPEVAK